jgi:apolipoprotein N-acyltransferase
LSGPEDAPLAAGTLLVWPESAFPFALAREPGTLAAIAALLPEGSALVTGAYRSELLPEGQEEVFNTIYVVGDDGTILDAYDKAHLVPFGEYVPAEAVLDRLGLRQLAPLGFSAGPPRQPLQAPVGPAFAPLICYEAIFSGAVLGDGERPGFLLNVTNDGWFGRTVGPYQHFHQARVRGVEEGLPLVRAANTGISAIIDPYGRVVAGSRLGEARAVDGRLPRATGPTLYAQWRGLILLLFLGVCAGCAATKSFYRVSAA